MMKSSRDIPPLPGYVTTTEAAKILGVSRFTVNRWYWEDKIQDVFRLGEVMAISINEIDRLKKGINEKL
jgi:predicted site-specific integrase-resolvase